MIRAVAFDKDGTLFDFEATWRGWAERVLAELSVTSGVATAALGGAIGLGEAGFARESPVIAGTSAEVTSLLAAAIAEGGGVVPPNLEEWLDAEAARAPLSEVVPLGAFFREIEALGLRTGVVTNDTEAAARAHLARVGAAPGLILGFDSGHGAKPEAGPLLAFARWAGVAAGEVAMVGDSLHDLAAARAAGAVPVGVLTGPATREDLAPAAEVVLGSIAELPGWLAARAAAGSR